MHDLVRTYAAELARTGGTDPHAIRRLLDHYLHTAYAADRLLDPHRDPITLAPAHDGVTPDRLDTHERGLAWFTGEYPVLLAVLRRASADRYDVHV